MRTRVWWLIGLMAALLGSGLAQSLVLTNGDVNGDNQVDDADLVSILFAMGQSCPSGCPEDLNGDGVVDDADLVIVLFNLGAQGAPEFAGQVQSPQGAFSVSLTVRLGDWVGSAQPVKVQLKPVGRESDATVPIFEYRVSVGGTDTTVQLDNLPAGAYTVRAFGESSGRWLRTEGKLITEVPWIFAAPTGANKVTVYWGEVPGATGYRVRWGTVSGSYPNSSAVLPATARQHAVLGLVSEQEYYFVVEAEYNGLWGSPSEEDSAIPHIGAIPWDTQDPDEIIPAIRAALGVYDGDISVLSPDDWYYTETGGVRSRTAAELRYDESTASIVGTGGALFKPAPQAPSRSRDPDNTGPYRRVRTRQGLMALEAQGMFYLPPPRRLLDRYILSEPSTWMSELRGTRDTPYVYFGVEYRDRVGKHRNIEGGVSFHPANRGLRVEVQPGLWEERGGDRTSPPPNYDRWNIYMRLSWHGSEAKVVGRFGEHLSYGVNGQDAPYGFVVWMHLRLSVDRNKLVSLHLHAWRYVSDDPPYGPPHYKRVVVGCAYREIPVPLPDEQDSDSQVRWVVSIAQLKQGTQPDGWKRTGSYFLKCGVAHAPLFVGENLQGISAYLRSSGWHLLLPSISEQPKNFPEGVGVIRVEPPIEQWYREVVNIDLRRR